MADQDVKQLLLQVDASMELLRRELGKGEQKLTDFERFVARKTKQADGHFSGMGRGLSGVRDAVGSVQTSIIAMGASLATYFSGRELVQLLDSFTRLQNSLRVAGLEGDELKQVQDALFVSAQKNGIAINTLADLYGKAAASQKELGATQSQLLKLTDLTAKSLLITGTSTEQASGAILGLGQALGNTKLQAEEFNQINEGGLRPLLQAAAAGERFGGSVSKLRQAVVDGKVSNQEFFDLILKGAKDIEAKAGKATLTLAGGYNALTNALIIYFGEADKANGVSAALGATLQRLADNLDTIVPAVTLLVTALGVRYVVAATAAAASTLMTSNAMLALQARMVGAATTAEALSFAMNGLKGGAITVAILALGGAFYYLATRENTAADAALRYQAATSKANMAKTEATDLARKLAAATGEERRQTELAIAAALKKAKADQIAGASALRRAAAELALAQASAARVEKSEAANTTGRGSAELGTVRTETQRNLRLKTGEVQGLTELQKALNDTVKILQDPLNVPALPSIDTPSPDGKGKGKGRSGPSAADIEDRFNSEIVNFAQQALSAQASMAQSAEERAEFELRGVELARKRTESEIKANTDYSAVQKERLLAHVAVLAELERERVAFDKMRQIEQDAQQLADAEFQAKSDALRIQYDLTDSNAERRRLAQEIVDLEIRHQRAILDAIIASETATKADKERAQVMLRGLGAVENGRREQAAQEHESPGERYMRDLTKEAVNLGDAYEDAAVNGLNRLNDSLAESAKSALGLHGILGDIVGDLIEIAIRQAVIGPLASAIFGGGGGGFLGGLFGRAAGGPVQAGRPYVVGEHGRPELFVPNVPGKVISNLQGGGAGGGGGGGVNLSVTINAPGATAETVAAMRREIANAAPALVAAAKGSMAREMNRRRI